MRTTVAAIAASAAAAAGLLLPPNVVPSYAESTVVVLNAAGGTNAADGLKIEAADGVVQVTRAGQAQVMDGTTATPGGQFIPANLLQNTYLVVSTSPKPTVIALDTQLNYSKGDLSIWDKVTTTKKSSDGKSGSITSLMTKDLDGKPATTNDIYSVAWTVQVKQPGPSVSNSFAVTLPAGSPAARLYWATTPRLGAETTFVSAQPNNPNMVLLATTPNTTDLGAFIPDKNRSAQSVSQPLGAPAFKWFAGWQGCVLRDCDPDLGVNGAPVSTDRFHGGFVLFNVDLPNWASSYNSGDAGVGADNALAIQFPAVTKSASFTSQWTFASALAMASLLEKTKRVAPGFASAPKTLKIGKSATLVKSAGFPAVVLASTTPKVCVVKGAAVTGKAKGACKVAAKVEGKSVKAFSITIVK